MLERYFADLDQRWSSDQADRVKLHLIGSTALMLQADYVRGTKDSDVIETSGRIKDQLLALGGDGSVLHHRHRIYLDFVSPGLPLLPQVPVWHPVDWSASLRHFELFVLDVVDVVVSKLKRFSASDVSDIEAMIERELVSHDALLDRFLAALDWFIMDARSSEFPKYVEHFNRVERDLLGVDETEIELPGWI